MQRIAMKLLKKTDCSRSPLLTVIDRGHGIVWIQVNANLSWGKKKRGGARRKRNWHVKDAWWGDLVWCCNYLSFDLPEKKTSSVSLYKIPVHSSQYIWCIAPFTTTHLQIRECQILHCYHGFSCRLTVYLEGNAATCTMGKNMIQYIPGNEIYVGVKMISLWRCLCVIMCCFKMCLVSRAPGNSPNLCDTLHILLSLSL